MLQCPCGLGQTKHNLKLRVAKHKAAMITLLRDTTRKETIVPLTPLNS